MGNNDKMYDDAIDLIKMSKIVWSNRLFVVKVVGIFFLIGLIVALTSKVEYKAYCRLLPESQEIGQDLGGLSGLAGLAGFDLSGLGSSAVLSPELYPEIVNSVLFLDELINTPVYYENRDTIISSFSYFKEVDRPSLTGLFVEYTIGLPGKVKKIFTSSKDGSLNKHDLIRYSKEDWEIIETYKERLSVSVNSKTGIINIAAEMPDAVASAKITELMVDGLTQRVTDYKIEKAQLNLQFVQERFEEAKLEYKSKQEYLARFTDRNRNLSNSIVQTEYERLQNEMDIAFEVYKGLATQLEQAKIKVKEETPVFTVLEPIQIPADKSKPKRALLVLGFIFMGLLSSITYLILKTILLNNVSK